jgi:hypothetical protein
LFKKKKPSYAWRIHFNCLQGQPCNIVGPQGYDETLLDRAGDRFEMKDDDGELYFRGTLHGDYTGFEPLEDFGRDGYGCTEIHIIHTFDIDGKRL